MHTSAGSPPFLCADADAAGALEAVLAVARLDDAVAPVLVTAVWTVRHAVTLVQHRDTLPAGETLPACRQQKGSFSGLYRCAGNAIQYC